MTLRIPQDVAAGLLLMAIGGFFLWWGWEYPVGRGWRVGPGWMPNAVCIILLALGALIALRGARAQGRRIAIAMPPPVALWWIVVATMSFVAIERLGLAVTAFVAAVLASLPSPDFRWRDALIFASVLTVFCVALFVYGLKQPLPVWPQ